MDGVEAFRFDQTTGVLTAAGTITTGNANTHRTRVTADGTALFFNSVQAGNTRIYRSSVTSGTMGTPALVEGTLPANSQFMNVEPMGRYLYTAQNTIFGINMYRTNGTGTLVSLGNMPINGTEQPIVGAFTSDGQAMYTLTFTRVLAYSINQTTGVLTTLSNHVVGGGHLAILPNERFVYVFDTGAALARVYTVNADRSLTLAFNQSAGGSGYDNACVERGGKFIFLTKNTNPAGILTYRVLDNGSLSPVFNTGSLGMNMQYCTTSIDSRNVWP